MNIQVFQVSNWSAKPFWRWKHLWKSDIEELERERELKLKSYQVGGWTGLTFCFFRTSWPILFRHRTLHRLSWLHESWSWLMSHEAREKNPSLNFLNTYTGCQTEDAQFLQNSKKKKSRAFIFLVRYFCFSPPPSLFPLRLGTYLNK